jgi:hypothetical protein
VKINVLGTFFELRANAINNATALVIGKFLHPQRIDLAMILGNI